MCFFPSFNVGLLLRQLVLAVREDIQELNRRFLKYLIPRTPARLAYRIYICNPTPSRSKLIAFSSSLSASSFLLLGFISFSISFEEIRESLIN